VEARGRPHVLLLLKETEYRMRKSAVGIDLDALTLTDAVAAMDEGRTTAEGLMVAVLERARETEPMVHAYVHLDDESALEAARRADRQRDAGMPCGPLHGVPVGVKDLIATADMPTSAGSALLATHRPAEDAEAVGRLRQAGAIVVGKHWTHEFGLGMNEPPTRNPWDLRRYPGGSTAGGGVSVAVGSCLAALGTDGGGSIRKPASINGLVGLKPTTGAVSTHGLVPGSTSMDHVGWLTRSVRDAATMLAVLADDHAGAIHDLERGVNGLRLGIPRFFLEEVEPDIAECVQGAVSALQSAGAAIVHLDMPALGRAARVHEVLMSAESYRLHERWLAERPDDYHPASREALLMGAQISPEALDEAKHLRRQLQQAFADTFSDHHVDALCGPSLALPPVLLGDMHPQEMLPKYCRLTLPFNVTGAPALSVPCGFDQRGLPVGIQIVGRLGDDELVLRCGQAVELARLWERPAFRRRSGALLERSTAEGKV